FDTIRGVVPVIEQLSFDEGFGEPPQLAGASAEDIEVFCEDLRRRVREETGLIASVGAGSGKQIAKIASGLAKPDGVRVVRRADAKQISSESTFAIDLTSLEQLREAIDPIAEHAHQRLLRDGRGARTVTVKLKKSDMNTLTRSATMPYATTEAGALIAVARRL